MKKINSLIALSIVILLSTSCLMSGVIGSRNVTTESRTIHADFTGIKVSQGIDVQLTQDQEVSISVELDDNLHELLVTEVVEGVLKIYFDESVSRRKASTIYLSMPRINSIKTNSGAGVNAVNTLKVNELMISASSGSEIDLRVEANSIESESSSGSEIDLKGTTMSFSADASSGSEIDADDLIAREVNAKASSGSDINVHATESIIAKASSGASIDCDGDPKEKEIKKSSGGDVRVN